MDASSTGWFKLQSNIRIPFMSLYTNWIAGNSNDNVIEIVATKCWIVWKVRCMRIFEGKSSNSLQTSLAVLRHLRFWTPSLLDVSSELDTGHISEGYSYKLKPLLHKQRRAIHNSIQLV